MTSPYCPACGLFADSGPVVTRRRLPMGLITMRDLTQQIARWHVSCWRLEFGRTDARMER